MVKVMAFLVICYGCCELGNFVGYRQGFSNGCEAQSESDTRQVQDGVDQTVGAALLIRAASERNDDNQ